MNDIIWSLGLALVVCVAVGTLCWLNVLYAKRLRAKELSMTPEERRENQVFAKASKKGWGSPF